MAKDVKKDKEPKQKIARREVNNCVISSGEILSALSTNLQLPNINAGPGDMLSDVVSTMQPSVMMRELLEPYFSKLTSNLSEFRTRHALQELEVEIDHVQDYDEQGLRLRLYAKTDGNALPDRPAMDGQQAKQILEKCFGEFNIDVDLSGPVPVFRQKTPLGFDLDSSCSINAVPLALPTHDPEQLFINIVHNICGVIQQHGGAVLNIHAYLDNTTPSATVQDFKAHVQARDGHKEPAKKKKATRKKK